MVPINQEVLQLAIGNFILAFISIYLCCIMIYTAVSAVASASVYEKAGEPGWKVLIPFYNTYTMFKFVYGEKEGWRFLLLLIPVANIVFSILLCIELARSFNKGGWFAVGLIFLPIIFMCILGFSKSTRYIGSRESRNASAQGIHPVTEEEPAQTQDPV